MDCLMQGWSGCMVTARCHKGLPLHSVARCKALVSAGNRLKDHRVDIGVLKNRVHVVDEVTYHCLKNITILT